MGPVKEKKNLRYVPFKRRLVSAKGGIARGKLYEQENTSNFYPMF